MVTRHQDRQVTDCEVLTTISGYCLHALCDVLRFPSFLSYFLEYFLSFLVHLWYPVN